MTCISYIKEFFNWKAKIDRKTFLWRFFDLLLISILSLFLGFIVHPIISIILEILALYMILCVLFQYIKTVTPKRTLIVYFSWIILYCILIKYIFPFVIGIFLWYAVPGMSILGLLIPPFIFIFPLLLILEFILSAWLLSAKLSFSLIQKITDFLIVIWNKFTSIFYKK